MHYFFRNLHILVFAVVSVIASVVVANRPDDAARIIRPVVEDAVELGDLAAGAYQELKSARWQEVSDEAVSLYTATLRMPSRLWERLAERLADVEEKISTGRASGPDLRLEPYRGGMPAPELRLGCAPFAPVPERARTYCPSLSGPVQEVTTRRIAAETAGRG